MRMEPIGLSLEVKDKMHGGICNLLFLIELKS